MVARKIESCSTLSFEQDIELLKNALHMFTNAVGIFPVAATDREFLLSKGREELFSCEVEEDISSFYRTGGYIRWASSRSEMCSGGVECNLGKPTSGVLSNSRETIQCKGVINICA